MLCWSNDFYSVSLLYNAVSLKGFKCVCVCVGGVSGGYVYGEKQSRRSWREQQPHRTWTERLPGPVLCGYAKQPPLPRAPLPEPRAAATAAAATGPYAVAGKPAGTYTHTHTHHFLHMDEHIPELQENVDTRAELRAKTIAVRDWCRGDIYKQPLTEPAVIFKAPHTH